MPIPSSTQKLVNTLPEKYKHVAKFIAMQESDDSLANIRFIQDTAVNWVPKAVFARSLADFTEMSFLEFSESLLVYYGPKLLGDKVFSKLFSKNLTSKLKNMISTPADKLLKTPDNAKQIMPIKAALAVGGLTIPILEYSLSYIKNLFTVKVFNQADFNNIANLNKDKQEDIEHQNKVKESAKKHLKLAGIALTGCITFASLLASRGKNSKLLNSISEAILIPGNKLFKNDAKKAATFNRYFGLDSSGLCRGQLTTCVLAGFLGYTGAAKDRGKQNLYEVLFRFPLVGFYVITGSELLEKGFKMLLKRKESYKDIIGKDLKVPNLSELPKLAEKLAKQNKTSVENEFKNLFKQKSLIMLAPFLFSIGFMGFFVAGSSRFFTQYRYNKALKEQSQQTTNKERSKL